jgi:hypothetical protein
VNLKISTRALCKIINLAEAMEESGYLASYFVGKKVRANKVWITGDLVFETARIITKMFGTGEDSDTPVNNDATEVNNNKPMETGDNLTMEVEYPQANDEQQSSQTCLAMSVTLSDIMQQISDEVAEGAQNVMHAGSFFEEIPNTFYRDQAGEVDVSSEFLGYVERGLILYRESLASMPHAEKKQLASKLTEIVKRNLFDNDNDDECPPPPSSSPTTSPTAKKRKLRKKKPLTTTPETSPSPPLSSATISSTNEHKERGEFLHTFFSLSCSSLCLSGLSIEE